MKLLVLTILALTLTPVSVAESRTDSIDKLFAAVCEAGFTRLRRCCLSERPVVYKKAYGTADLEPDVPLTTDSVFDVGLNRQAIHGGQRGATRAAGQAKIHGLRRKYVPELPAYYERVTIDHLIHHTSGMTEVAALVILIHEGLGQQHISDLEAEARDGQGDFHMSNDEFIQLMSRLKSLNFQPGEQFQYTKSNYILLAVIVKRASGKPLPMFAKENIFDSAQYEEREVR